MVQTRVVHGGDIVYPVDGSQREYPFLQEALVSNICPIQSSEGNEKKRARRVQNELIDLDIDRKLETERETAYRSNLIMATAMVTCQAMASGKKPAEAVEMFTQTYQLMQDWYKAKPLKQQIEQIMGMVLPERINPDTACDFTSQSLQVTCWLPEFDAAIISR